MTEKELLKEDYSILKELTTRCSNMFNDLGYETNFNIDGSLRLNKGFCAWILELLSESEKGIHCYPYDISKPTTYTKIKFKTISELDLKLTIRGY